MTPTVSIQDVAIQIDAWARDAAADAVATPDFGKVVSLNSRARHLRRMHAAVVNAMATIHQLDASRIVAAPKARAVRKAADKVSALQWFELRQRAHEAICAVYGERWKVCAPIGETVLASLPSALRNGKTERGTKLRWHRDHRLPAAKYWPDGVIPGDVTYCDDGPRETKQRAWGDMRDGMSNGGYEQWQAAWAARNGLFYRSGAWVPDEAVQFADAAD